MGERLTPAVLLGSNRTKPCVRQVYGISGQGKTVMLCESIRKAARLKDFGPKHRFIIFDVKHDGYETLAPPVSDVGLAIRKMDKDRVVVIHPEMDNSFSELDDIIDYLFEVARYDSEFSATLLVEESSTFISGASIPASIKRFATQGRSLGLSLLLVNQRALNSRWTDTQSASITCFRLAIPDKKLLLDRWGLLADEMDAKLSEKKFSFSHYDLEGLDLSYYDPIEIPKNRTPIVKKKKRTDFLKLPFER